MDDFSIRRTLEELQSESWLLEENNDYMRQFVQDSSGISVTHWSHMSVGIHAHRYYEFSMILSGECVHSCKGTSRPMIPGDVFLIAPHERHSYKARLPVEMYICQFYADQIDDETAQFLKEYVDYNQHEIIHLQEAAVREAKFLMEKMMREQRGSGPEQRIVKKACLNLLLVILQRARNQVREQGASQILDEKRSRIQNVIDYMDTHLQEKIETNKLAEISCWSEGHFRAVFKEATGFSPVEYLNRMRIVKAISYMQTEGVSVAEAADRVGFYDHAYFSRVFSSVIGCSPRRFRSDYLTE